jgi:hypothetical protein
LLSDKTNKMRQTFVGNLMSKISMNKNKEFYEKQKDINPMSEPHSKEFEFKNAQLE